MSLPAESLALESDKGRPPAQTKTQPSLLVAH
jgi:hypothetical protein